MGGSTKLMSSGTGGVILTTPGSIAADVTVNLPTQNSTLAINGPAFSAWLSSNQNLAASNTFYKINFDAEEYDTNNNFSGGTFMPTVAGYYMISASAQLVATSATNEQITLYKNGAAYKFLGVQATAGTPTGSTLVYLNGTTDYIEIWGKVTGTGAWAVSASQSTSYFTGCLVRAA